MKTISVLLCSFLLFFFAVYNIAQSHESGQLEVVQLIVSPKTVDSSGEININAIVENHTGLPIHDVDIQVAVASVQRELKEWKLIQKIPLNAVNILPENGRIEVNATIQIIENGWYMVGIAGAGPDARFAPVSTRVHVTSLYNSIIDLSFLFFMYCFPIGTLFFTAKALTNRTPRLNINKTLVTGIGGIIVATTTWFLVKILFDLIPVYLVAIIIVFGFICWISGWVMLGIGIKFGGDFKKGAFGFLIIYLMLGMLWSASLAAGLNGEMPTYFITTFSYWTSIILGLTRIAFL